jgi:hypothetical protein
MRKRIKRLAAKIPFGRQLFRRYYDLVVDAYLISYPKCGRTWLRLMLGKVLVSHFELKENDLIDIEQLAAKNARIPRIQVTHDSSPHLKRPDELETDKRRYRGKKVIFLVRDPRDVIISNYFQATKRDKYFQGDISSFIRHNRYGIDTMLRFMNIWHQSRHIPDGFLLVRYEDLQEDTYQQLQGVVCFLGLDSVKDKILRDAIEFARFGSMQKMEREGLLNSPRLKPGDPTDPESYKMRRGKVGGHQDYLDSDDIEYLNYKIETELAHQFGYNMPQRIR